MALIVKKSLLPNAGLGLFTTKAIKKDCKIIEYRGERIGNKKYRERARKQMDYYLFYVRKNLCIDAMHTPQYKARYANDALGLTRVKGLKNNSDYIIYGNKCFMVSSKDIKAGEEIFVNYTKPYWDCMRRRLEKQKRKK
jgi:uncharacterized protein